MRRLAAGAAFLALVGCHNADNTIASAEVALTAAETAASAYTSSPSSNPSTVATLRALDNKAYTAVKAAENNEGTISAALTAIDALKGAIP